jgi:hypothetical protein
MAAPDLRGLIQVGLDILTTVVNATTKKILAQLGDVHKETTDADNAEWWQHVGFASRPPKPEAGKKAAQAAVLRAGDHDVIIASQDLRGLELYGQLAPGETALYASGEDGKGQARILLKKDGSINLFTKAGNATGGKGMGIFVNPDGSVSIASSNGAAVLIGDDGSLKVFNKSGGIQIKADGHVKIASGSKVEISGGSITLGGPAALPLAVGPQVVTAITALQTQVSLQAAAWAALGALSGPVLGVMIQPIAAPIAGATVAGNIAVAAANALIPTKRTSGD